MRLIDADALRKLYSGWIPQLTLPEDERDKEAIETCIAVMDDAPTIDAVEVVRCKDCKWGIACAAYPLIKWCNQHGTHFENNDFCNYGERRADNG